MSLVKNIYEKKELRDLEIPLRDLEIELRNLQKWLKYKSNPFCKKKLEVIIKNYFGEK
ncbi:MAG: hypothetical protein ACTSRG_20210 [Candidatus Helarchaeota archaeon]